MEYKGIFDTHAHYDDERFDEDRDTVLKNVFEHGVSLIVDPACDLETCEKTLELSSKYDFVYSVRFFNSFRMTYIFNQFVILSASEESLCFLFIIPTTKPICSIKEILRSLTPSE